MSRTDSSADLRPYLLISNWTVHRHQGKLWTRPLWAKDLQLHFGYIQRIRLACPVKNTPPPADFGALREDLMDRIEVVGMPAFETKRQRLINGLPFLGKILRHCLRAEIVHFTAAGHPILFGILIPWLRRRGGTGLVGYVESSFWRKPGSKGITRWIAELSERCVKSAISSAHATFLTQEAYLTELTDPANSNHVTRAVWIDEESILEPDALTRVLESRRARGGMRIAFFGQLRPEKGPDLLLEALRKSRADGLEIELHVFGKGPMEESLRAQSTDLASAVQWRGYVAYGPEFFEVMSGFDAVVIPTRSDEQPRIVFDAYSQGVPVVASRTRGLSSVVDHGSTGLLFDVDSAGDLAAQLTTIARDPQLRETLSRNACTASRKVSHAAMHRFRAEVLRETFPHAQQLRVA